MSLESFLIRERVYCESPNCLSKAKICREIDGGRFRVSCWQHDPETIADFDAWLQSNQDAIGDATDFTEWLSQREDTI